MLPHSGASGSAAKKNDRDSEPDGGNARHRAGTGAVARTGQRWRRPKRDADHGGSRAGSGIDCSAGNDQRERDGHARESHRSLDLPRRRLAACRGFARQAPASGDGRRGAESGGRVRRRTDRWWLSQQPCGAAAACAAADALALALPATASAPRPSPGPALQGILACRAACGLGVARQGRRAPGPADASRPSSPTCRAANFTTCRPTTADTSAPRIAVRSHG